MRGFWRSVALLMMVCLVGCSGEAPDEGSDADSAWIRAGSLAVLVDGPDPEVSGAFLLPEDPDSDSEKGVGQFLGAGVRVRIVDDPGSLDRTRADIDREIRQTEDPQELDELRKEEPQGYAPPHWPKPNIRVTRGKVGGYAASASVGSMGKRAFMSRRKIPYGLTWP